MVICVQQNKRCPFTFYTWENNTAKNIFNVINLNVCSEQHHFRNRYIATQENKYHYQCSKYK
nr:hypothetical protein Itr_chr06CG23810 [Ipomoea trifida]